MAGLYDGLEEIAFKRIAGGYLFQSNNPWLIGPRRCYLVNEAQKVEIAACVRETLRRIKPFVFLTAILIPLVLVAAVFWLATNGGTLSVTVTSAAGKSTTYTQPIASTGSTGTLVGPAHTKVIFHVSGVPGKGSTVSYTRINAAGEAHAPTVVSFSPAGNKLNLTDANGRIFSSVILVGRSGAPSDTIVLYAILLALGMFVPYVALMHIYSMRRLRPLIAGLPRSNERITWREGVSRFASKASFKLLVFLATCGVFGVAANTMNFIAALLDNRPINNPHIFWLGMAVSALSTAYFVYLIILRMKLKRNSN